MKFLIGAAIVIAIAFFLLKGTGKSRIDDNKKKVKFTFLTLDPNEPIPTNCWYQRSSWSNKNFVNYRGTWDSDWKWTDEGKVSVVGLTRGNRTESFLKLAGSDDFKMYLEDEPDNPVDKNARKVMASATLEGINVAEQIGYLPKEIAEKYAGVELNIRPAKAFIPTKRDQTLSLGVALLVRSARYLKKQKKK
jgi:hypothetical protein